MLSKQQNFIYGFALLFLILLILLFTKIFMTVYIPFYSSLTPNEMVVVIEHLNSDNIDYRIQDLNNIFIPEKDLFQERKHMESLGLISEEKEVLMPMADNNELIVNYLLYSVSIAIGLFFFLNIWSRNKYIKKDNVKLKTDDKKLIKTVNQPKVLIPHKYDTLVSDLEKHIELRKNDVVILIESVLDDGIDNSIDKELKLELHLKKQYLNLSDIDKIAFVLGQLNAHVTASIFEIMRPVRMREISVALSKGIIVKRELAKVLLEEFTLLMQRNPYVKSGSKVYVKTVLNQALESENAEKILSEIVMIVRRHEFFSWLETINPELIAKEIRLEHPQAIALLLAHLNESVTAKVLDFFSILLAEDILKRIATLNMVSYTVFEIVMDGLESKLYKDNMKSSVGGEAYIKMVQNAMNKSHDFAISNDLLDQTDSSFEEVLNFDNSAIRRVLKLIDKRELIYALKGTSEELQELFLANMSPSINKILYQEINKLNITDQEIRNAQNKILRHVRNIDEE